VRYISNILISCFIANSSPPSLRKSGTRESCSLARTLMNFWKSAILLRVRNSVSFSLRSRGCVMLIRKFLCDHAIQPALTSSVTNATSATTRSSTWPAFDSLRICGSSNGRTSPYSAPISAVSHYTITMLIDRTVQITQKNIRLTSANTWSWFNTYHGNGVFATFAGNAVGAKLPIQTLSRVLEHTVTKFQRLPLYFRGQTSQY